MSGIKPTLKVCKLCNTTKPVAEFVKARLLCQSCYNKKQLTSIEEKKKQIVVQNDRSEIILQKQDATLQKVDELLEMKDKMTNMEEKVNELINVNKQLISMIDTTTKNPPAVNNTISPKATKPVAKSTKTKNQ